MSPCNIFNRHTAYGKDNNLVITFTTDMLSCNNVGDVDNIFAFCQTFVYQIGEKRTDDTNGVVCRIWILLFPLLIEAVIVEHHLEALGNQLFAVKS